MKPRNCIFEAPPFYKSTLFLHFHHHLSGSQKIKLSAIFSSHILWVGVDAVTGFHPVAEFPVFFVRHSFPNEITDQIFAEDLFSRHAHTPIVVFWRRMDWVRR